MTASGSLTWHAVVSDGVSFLVGSYIPTGRHAKPSTAGLPLPALPARLDQPQPNHGEGADHHGESH